MVDHVLSVWPAGTTPPDGGAPIRLCAVGSEVPSSPTSDTRTPEARQPASGGPGAGDPARTSVTGAAPGTGPTDGVAQASAVPAIAVPSYAPRTVPATASYCDDPTAGGSRS